MRMKNDFHAHHTKKLYGTATVGSKGQVVIPVEAREELGIEPGDKFYVIGVGGSVGFVKEEILSHIVEKMSLQLEDLKAIQKIDIDK